MTSLCIVFVVLLVANYHKGEDLNFEIDKKFNVVVFLAATTTTEQYQHNSGITYLNFIEKTRVKHCATGDNSVSSFTAMESDCKELLKAGIYSLIGYCRNVMGMTTAVASIENDTFTNGLRFKKSTSEDLEIRYHNPKSVKGRSGIRADGTKPRYITEPEHTEIFKIRSRRQDASDEIPQFETPEETPKDWDVFGIVANIKLTFFGKLFEKNKNQNEEFIEKTQNKVMNKIGNTAQNSLFDLVQETLVSLQDCSNGFLMIIIGGFLIEVSDIYSTFMQSVKHVVENTDERNTLIVVTGTCPLVDGVSESGGEFSIPVYVRGPPKTNGIRFAGQLSDVPYAIKNLLSEMNGGALLNPKRDKRHAVQLQTKKKRNSGHRNWASSLLIVVCVFFLID